MVRALASHQCGPGSNPGIDAICGLSLLLVLSLAPRGFSPGTPVFPSSGTDDKSEYLEYLVLTGRSKRYEQNIIAQRGGGEGTQQSFIRGGSTPRSDLLPFYIPFLTEEVSLSHT